jgi:hypothetical protein
MNNTYDDPTFTGNGCYRNENTDMGCGTAILAILAEMKAPNQLMPLTLTIGVEFNRKWNVTIVIKLLFEGDAIVKGQKV